MFGVIWLGPTASLSITNEDSTHKPVDVQQAYQRPKTARVKGKVVVNVAPEEARMA